MYAALDRSGATRYVGDVPRGAACGCICPACTSPLVARRGEEREWHFAHEARQERPACLVGAVNLLRRTAIEWLQAQEHLPLPEYVQAVTSAPPLPSVTELVGWKDWPVRFSGWRPGASRSEPVACIEMNTGLQVDLHVEVGDRAERDRPPCGEVGAVEFWVPAPAPGQLRHEADAHAHVAAAGNFTWLYQPDVHGCIARAQRDVDAKAQKIQQEREFLERQSFSIVRPYACALTTPAPRAPVQAPAPPAEGSTPWDAWRKPKSSFIHYRASRQSDEGWVHVRHRDQRAVMVPWPTAWEGWDEFFPASHAHVDKELGAMVLVQEVNAMLLVSRTFKGGICNYSTFAEIPGSKRVL